MGRGYIKSTISEGNRSVVGQGTYCEYCAARSLTTHGTGCGEGNPAARRWTVAGRHRPKLSADATKFSLVFRGPIAIETLSYY